ncbi:MAG: hypothetical protein NVSMB52_10180 [Chloroflexota bacterium]
MWEDRLDTVYRELHPLPPYDFGLALRFLRTSPSAVAESVSEDGAYQRAVRVVHSDVLLRLRSIGSVEAPRLGLEVKGERIDEATVEQARALVVRVFQLDLDPAPFFAVVSQDPVFDKLLERFPGMRPVLIADPYEALIWAIIGQQINISFARKLKATLVEICGRTLTVDGDIFPVLPTPMDVARCDPDVLRRHQFSRQKIAYLIELSRAVCDGAIRFEELRSVEYDEAVAALTRFKGIGRWTAEYVLMRGFGAADSIPAADVGLRAIIGRSYGLGRAATEIEVRTIAEQWTPWRGWAATYWWMALQQGLSSI